MARNARTRLHAVLIFHGVFSRNAPTALKLPFGSIPVPYTTNTRRKVRIASTRIPTAGVTVHERPGGLPRAGVPRWDACQTEAGKMTLRPNAATRAPSNWDPQ